MTMSITLVNTSNWKGEDMHVDVIRQDIALTEKEEHIFEGNLPAAEIMEKLSIDQKSRYTIIISPQVSDEKPFRDGDGKQVFPEVKVEMK